jgi:hypothetical protein
MYFSDLKVFPSDAAAGWRTLLICLLQLHGLILLDWLFLVENTILIIALKVLFVKSSPLPLLIASNMYRATIKLNFLFLLFLLLLLLPPSFPPSPPPPLVCPTQPRLSWSSLCRSYGRDLSSSASSVLGIKASFFFNTRFF